MNTENMEKKMSLILTIGMLIASILVIIGGSIFLLQHGTDNLQSAWIQSTPFPTTIAQIAQAAISLSPMGIVEIGLLILVFTQVIRVALLVWFYAVSHDYKFSLISLFILITLIYSFFWRK